MKLTLMYRVIASHGFGCNIESSTEGMTDQDASFFQRVVQVAANAGKLAAESVEMLDSTETQDRHKYVSLSQQDQSRARATAKQPRLRIRLPPMGTFPPSPPTRSCLRDLNIHKTTRTTKTLKTSKSNSALISSYLSSAPPPRHVSRRSKRLSEAVQNKSSDRHSGTLLGYTGSTTKVSKLSKGKRGTGNLLTLGQSDNFPENARILAHSGDMRAWLQDTLAASRSMRTEEPNGSKLLSSKAKMYTMLDSQEIQRILALPDIDQRAQHFVEALTGTRIPLHNHFWSEPRGKSTLQAVAQWKVHVKIKEMTFESGERLTVVEF